MTGSNIFHMELIVKRVTLYDPHQATNTCPACLSFRFPGIVDLEICEGEHCGHSPGLSGGTEIHVTRGKSCLFTVDSADLCCTMRDFYADIALFRRVTGSASKTILVAQSRLDFDGTFTEIIGTPSQPDRTRETEQTLDLFEKDRPNPVGKMEVYVRLTSQGGILVTRFIKDPDNKKLQYKGLNDYTPANPGESKIKCSKRHDKRCCRKKCIKACEPECEMVACTKNNRRKATLVMAVQMMTKMFQNAKKVPANEGSGTVTVHRCEFDEFCRIPNCPFQVIDPPPESKDEEPDEADELSFAENAEGVLLTAEPPVVEQIEDDADLFVLGIDRVDTCQLRKLVSYRSIATEYLDEDWMDMSVQPEAEPEPEPLLEKQPAKSAKKGKGKKKK